MGMGQMVREEGPSSLMRGATPNVFRAILMNASQLASYDFFKSELLKTKYFEDNIYCHFTASFAAGTVATTVCSPADVLKVRSLPLFPLSLPLSLPPTPRSFVRSSADENGWAEPHHERVGPGLEQHAGRDPELAEERGRDVHVQGLGARVDAAAADDDPHLPHARAAEERRRLDARGHEVSCVGPVRVEVIMGCVEVDRGRETGKCAAIGVEGVRRTWCMRAWGCTLAAGTD